MAFLIGGGLRSGWRALMHRALSPSLAIAAVIKLMGLDRGGLPVGADQPLGRPPGDTGRVSITGIVTSLPIGIALALGRRSTIPLIRIFSITFIEFWRGVPLITVLFFATYMLPLFLPGNFSVDGLVRALIGIALFTGALIRPRTSVADWPRSRAGRARRPRRSACPGGRRPRWSCCRRPCAT